MLLEQYNQQCSEDEERVQSLQELLSLSKKHPKIAKKIRSILKDIPGVKIKHLYKMLNYKRKRNTKAHNAKLNIFRQHPDQCQYALNRLEAANIEQIELKSSLQKCIKFLYFSK